MIKCSAETLSATTNLIETKTFENKLSEAYRLVEEDVQFEMSSNMESARQALRSSIEAVKGAQMNSKLTKNNDGEWYETLGNSVRKLFGADDESNARTQLEKAQAAFEMDFDSYLNIREKDSIFNDSVNSTLGIMKYKKWFVIGGIVFVVYLLLIIVPILLDNKSRVSVDKNSKKSEVTVQQAYPQVQPIFLQIPQNYYQQPDQAVAIRQEMNSKSEVSNDTKDYYYKDVSWGVLSDLCEKYGLNQDYILQVYGNDADKACARVNMYGVACGGDTKQIMAKVHKDKGGV